MESVSVVPAQVIDLSSTIRTKSGQIKTELETLDSKTTQLRNSWEGSSKDAYHVAQVDWNKKIGELEQLLGQISAKLAEIAQGYSDTDRKGANRFM
jgi:WXG100 family type VII secretion target